MAKKNLAALGEIDFAIKAIIFAIKIFIFRFGHSTVQYLLTFQ